MMRRAVRVKMLFNDTRKPCEVVNDGLSWENMVVNNDPTISTINDGHASQGTTAFSQHHLGTRRCEVVILVLH